jgi:hypothetical protein
VPTKCLQRPLGRLGKAHGIGKSCRASPRKAAEARRRFRSSLTVGRENSEEYRQFLFCRMSSDYHKSTRFVFLEDTHANPRAFDQQALQQADSTARKHAARITHELRRRRKLANRPSTQPRNDRILQRLTQTNRISNVSYGFLDPFLRLPTDYDRRQRNLIHHCTSK